MKPVPDQYQKTVLKNGLRVVSEKMPSVRSISLGIWVDVGSRCEAPHEAGASHFIEHMLFKGTRRRTARKIASEIESIGGVLNAFTSREQTCYVVRVMDEHLEIAIDVLADMLSNATLTPSNLKREKQVICEEIKETIDNPSEHIHDLFAEAFWGNHPLGRPIMGSMQTITEMPRKTVTNYINRHYRAGSIVVAASGSISHRKLVRLAREKFVFPTGTSETPSTSPSTDHTRLIIKPDDNQQTHVCLGFPGINYTSDEKMAAMLLSTHLGGGMSSVLFQKVREQKGLAYAVYTFLDFYRDKGIFGAYAATDGTHLRQAVDIILVEIERLKKKKLASNVLDQTKNQLKGNIMLGMESTMARMNRLGRYELMYGQFHQLSKVLREIDRVTPTDVLTLTNQIVDRSRMAAAVLGPAERDDIAHVF